MLILSGGKNMERLMIDAAHIKVHPYAVEAKGGNEGMSHTKGGTECQTAPCGRHTRD